MPGYASATGGRHSTTHDHGRPPGRSGPSGTGSRSKFWGCAYALLILLTGTNLPTPLYDGYQRLFGFSPLVMTLIFAVYVAALIPSLLIAGPLSDAIGRRRVLLPAAGMALLGSLVFALATETAWLFAARAFQGIAIGFASGTLTATLIEHEPAGDHRKAALVSTVATTGGMVLGPVLAGLLAQYAPAPHVLPYVLEIVLLVPAIAVLATLTPTGPTTRWKPRRPQVPREVRGVFASRGTAGFLAFATTGVFLSLVPGYVAELSGSSNLLLSGATVALMLACSSAAQLVGYGRRSLELVGLPLLALGVVLLAVASGPFALGILLVATVIAGLGQGFTFLGVITELNQAAPADRRADVLSTFYVVLYLGTGTPVIGVGFLATTFGLLPAVRTFAVVLALLCVTLLTVLVIRRRSRTLA